MTSHSPIFVFGISGATWNVIDPLLQAGKLPNLQKLQENGCRATLLSVKEDWDKHYRPQVAWASIATGCDPDKHGITRFFHTSDDLKVPTLWEIFHEQSCRSGIYGWPIDWPPQYIDGFVIPSHWARDIQTWPPELAFIKAFDREQQNAERAGRSLWAIATKFKSLLSALRLGIHPHTLGVLACLLARIFFTKNSEERSLLLRHAKIELNADFFISLCKRFDPHFLSFHTFLVDLASHRYWRYYQPQLFPEPIESSEFLDNAVINAYILTDRILGRIIDHLPNHAIVTVVSEHGMEAELEPAELGEWRYLINGNRLSKLVGLEDKITACPVARWIAFRPITDSEMPEDAADRFRRIMVVETGLPLFQVYQHGRDEVVVKFNIERSVARYQEGNLDHLTIAFDDHYFTFCEITQKLGRVRSAMHAEEGIFLISGKGIKSGKLLENMRATDLAPTLLRIAGIPIPDYMDGAPIGVLEEPG